MLAAYSFHKGQFRQICKQQLPRKRDVVSTALQLASLVGSMNKVATIVEDDINNESRQSTTEQKHHMVPTLIKSIASKLAFGMMSDRFAGTIYQKNDRIQMVREETKEEVGFH